MLWKSKSGLFHSLSRVSATQASHTVQQSTLTELFVFPLQSSFTGPSGCADCHVPGSAAGHRTPGKSKPMESILKHIFLLFFLTNLFFFFFFLTNLVFIWQVSAAMEPLQAALSLCGDDLHSLHLLTLLLSAQKHHRHALDTLTLALGQHPDNFK